LKQRSSNNGNNGLQGQGVNGDSLFFFPRDPRRALSSDAGAVCFAGLLWRIAGGEITALHKDWAVWARNGVGEIRGHYIVSSVLKKVRSRRRSAMG
jgi:hypothetical protein